MVYKILLFILAIQCCYCHSLNSVTSLFQNFFSQGRKDQQPVRNYKLESICFSTDSTSNQKMPTKIHLVIIYDYELAKDLIKRTAKQYFRMLENLINTHAQFLKIMEWTFPAQEYLSPYIAITYNNKSIKPACIILFTDVGGKKGKLGRYVISEHTRHLHVYIKNKRLQIDESQINVLKALKEYKKKFGNKIHTSDHFAETNDTFNNDTSTICNMSLSPNLREEDYYNPLDQMCMDE